MTIPILRDDVPVSVHDEDCDIGAGSAPIHA